MEDFEEKTECVRWCAAKMKAKEIDEVDWKKIIVDTVFVIGILLIVYCCHPYKIYVFVDIIKMYYKTSKTKSPGENFFQEDFPKT